MPRPHQQQCRSYVAECYKVERYVGIVAVLATISKQRSTFVAKNCNIVEATGNKVAAVASTMLLRHCCWCGSGLTKRSHCA